MNNVTSIIYSNNRGKKVRFVLDGYREPLYRMEDKMAEAGCEPLLVVSREDANEWWLDDICMIGDILGIDELFGGEQVLDNPVVKWLEQVQSLTEGQSATCDFRLHKQKLGINSDLVLTATASTEPCDEAHGQCTNNCNPIEL